MKPAHQYLLITTIILAAAARGAHAEEKWQWSLTPYIWATDISEDLLVDGEVVGGDDTEFKDLMDKIDTSLQLHFEGFGDRWGLFADISYVDLKDSKVGEMELVRFDAEIEETVLEAGLIFRPRGGSGRFDQLLGARDMSVLQIYRPQLIGIGGREVQIDENYLDVLVGARWHIPLSDRWVISPRGDVSTGGTDLTWTAQCLLGWRFGKKWNSALFLGYRYREAEYTRADVVEVEKTVSGTRPRQSGTRREILEPMGRRWDRASAEPERGRYLELVRG